MKKFVSALPFLLLFIGASQAQSVYINEFLASNAAVNEDSLTEFDDWFEIYNPGSSPVDIGGYYFTDDFSNLVKYSVPTGDPATIIPAQGFLLIWCDEQGHQGALHTNFKLGAGGEQLGIFDASGNAIDSLTFGAQATDVSYGRQMDGGAPWITFNSPTPGASNETVGIDPFQSPSSFSVWPNPASNGEINFSETFTGCIFNLQGQQMIRIENCISTGTGNLPAGIYFIRSNSGATTKLEIFTN